MMGAKRVTGYGMGRGLTYLSVFDFICIIFCKKD